jgi:hypothetical protein
MNIAIFSLIVLALCGVAVGQYTPPPMSGPGATMAPIHHTYNGRTAGMAAGVAGAGAGIGYFVHRSHQSLTGCIAQDGNTIVADNGQRFEILNPKGVTLKPGENVSLKGKKESSSDKKTFEVRSIAKDIGPCR